MLELDYVSSKLRHEAHYSLDLAQRTEHSICLKLLDRVFKSRQESEYEGQEDQIANATYDGDAFSLRRWEITTARNADGLFVSDASRYHARSSKSMWRGELTSGERERRRERERERERDPTLVPRTSSF